MGRDQNPHTTQPILTRFTYPFKWIIALLIQLQKEQSINQCPYSSGNKKQIYQHTSYSVLSNLFFKREFPPFPFLPLQLFLYGNHLYIPPIAAHCTNLVHLTNCGRAYLSFARRRYLRSSRNCCFSDSLETSGGQRRLARYGFGGAVAPAPTARAFRDGETDDELKEAAAATVAREKMEAGWCLVVVVAVAVVEAEVERKGSSSPRRDCGHRS